MNKILIALTSILLTMAALLPTAAPAQLLPGSLKKPVSTTPETPEKLKERVLNLRNHAVLLDVPREYGRERTEKLNQAIEDLERAKALAESIPNQSELRTSLLTDLAEAHMRFVYDENRTNHLANAIAKLYESQETLLSAEAAYKTAGSTEQRQALETRVQNARGDLAASRAAIKSIRAHVDAAHDYFQTVEDLLFGGEDKDQRVSGTLRLHAILLAADSVANSKESQLLFEKAKKVESAKKRLTSGTRR